MLTKPKSGEKNLIRKQKLILENQFIINNRQKKEKEDNINNELDINTENVKLNNE